MRLLVLSNIHGKVSTLKETLKSVGIADAVLVLGTVGGLNFSFLDGTSVLTDAHLKSFIEEFLSKYGDLLKSP